MKTKEFILALRKVIREEVRSAVRAEIGIIINETRSSKQSALAPLQRPKQTKFNTGNAALDEILSETIVPRGFGGESGPVVGDYSELSYSTSDIPTNNLESLMSEDTLPDTTYNDPTMMFVKDYTKVLKKAEQISSR